jgi:hypothetical protein
MLNAPANVKAVFGNVNVPSTKRFAPSVIVIADATDILFRCALAPSVSVQLPFMFRVDEPAEKVPDE